MALPLIPRELGDARDNLAAYDVAMMAIAQGSLEWGIQTMRKIRDHIEGGNDVVSFVQVLPLVNAALGMHEHGVDDKFEPQAKEPLGIMLGASSTPREGHMLSNLIDRHAQFFLYRFLICDRATHRAVFGTAAPTDSTRQATPNRWRLIGGTAPSGSILDKTPDEGGAAELCHLISLGRVRSLMFLPRAEDLERTYARMILRAVVNANVELMLTFRSVFETITAASGMASHGALPSEGVAIVAHPAKKLQCMTWVDSNAALLAQCARIFATKGTGEMIISRFPGLASKVTCVPSGPEIGDETIAVRVMRNQIQHLAFFLDEQWAAPHDVAIIEMLKVCVRPEATVSVLLNPKSANAWAEGMKKAA